MKAFEKVKIIYCEFNAEFMVVVPFHDGGARQLKNCGDEETRSRNKEVLCIYAFLTEESDRGEEHQRLKETILVLRHSCA